MALKPCRECKFMVSSKAKICPNCGISKPIKGNSKLPFVILFGFISFVLISKNIYNNDKISVSETPAAIATGGSNQNKSKNTQEQKPPVDYARPLQTKRGTLVCPFSAAFDQREGRGLQAAMESRNEIFGRQEDAEKAGCNEWQKGIAITLSDDEQKKAQRWQAAGSCGMLEFPQGLVFSCDLENSPSSAPDISEKPVKNEDTEATKVSDELNLFNKNADKIYAEASTEDKKLLDFFKVNNKWVSPADFCGSGGGDEESQKYEQNLKENGWIFVYARDQKSSRIKSGDAAFTYGRWIKQSP